MNVPDQIPIWDEKHRHNAHNILRGVPSPFAKLAEPYFPEHAVILELGCGAGRDAQYFSSNHHLVTATDGSPSVIMQNQAEKSLEDVTSETIDMRQDLPYGDQMFDVVYANPSLDYYDDMTTHKIATEIARVLRQDGLIAVACKSWDSLHVQGKEIAPHIITSPEGQTLHFFSKQYTTKLFEAFATTEYLDKIEEDYKGRQSHIIRYIGKIKQKGTHE